MDENTHLYSTIIKHMMRGPCRNSDNDINKNRITNFQSTRWISPPEATWRIYCFSLNEVYHAVITLQLHLEF